MYTFVSPDEDYAEQLEEYKDFLLKRAALAGEITNIILKLYEEYSVCGDDMLGFVEEFLEQATDEIEYMLKPDGV